MTSSLVTPPAATDVDDGPAIAELHRLHALQRAAFRADPYPAAADRKARLGALAGMVMGHRDQIRAAMSQDFGSHPELFTDLVEVLGVAAGAAYAIEQLDSWMADEQRPADPAFYGTAHAAIRYQPKGVVGNIVPWNFPFDLSVGPLVEMLAAGNRVVIKPSTTPGLRRRAAARSSPTPSPKTWSPCPSADWPWPRSSRPCAGTTCCTPAVPRSAGRPAGRGGEPGSGHPGARR